MKSYRIAIIDDESAPAQQLQELLLAYGKKNELMIDVEVFHKPITFLDGFRCDYDMIFLDIEMPLLDGMSLAHKIRERDREVILIFVTNLAQYALEGYSVEARDYIVKPISPQSFELKMSRLLPRFSEEGQHVRIRSEGKVLVFAAKSILYVETDDHHVIYHVGDRTYATYERIKDVEKRLPAYFARCNRYYIVNLIHVEYVKGDSVFIHGVPLKMSRAGKRDFLEKLARYLNLKESNV